MSGAHSSSRLLGYVIIPIASGIALLIIVTALYVPPRPLFHNHLGEWPFRSWVYHRPLLSWHTPEHAFVDRHLNILVLVRVSEDEGEEMPHWYWGGPGGDVERLTPDRALFRAGGREHIVTRDEADRLIIIDHTKGKAMVPIGPGKAAQMYRMLDRAPAERSLAVVLREQYGEEYPDIYSILE